MKRFVTGLMLMAGFLGAAGHGFAGRSVAAQDLPLVHALEIPEGAIDVAFSPDGKRVATGGLEGQVKLWDAETGQEIKTAFPKFSFDARLKKATSFSMAVHVAFSPDGELLAVSCAQKLLLWDIAKKKTVSNFPAHGESITDVEFSPDGKTLATSGRDENVWLWPVDKIKGKTGRVPTGGQALVQPGKTGGYATSVSFSRDSKYLATIRGTRLMVWGLDNPRATVIATEPDGYNQVAFSPDGKRLAMNVDTNTEIWDVEKKAKQTTLEGAGYRTGVLFSPDGGAVITGDEAGTFTVTETRTFRRLWTSEQGDSIFGTALSADGRRLATARRDKGVEIWDVSRFSAPPGSP